MNVTDLKSQISTLRQSSATNDANELKSKINSPRSMPPASKHGKISRLNNIRDKRIRQKEEAQSLIKS